MKKKFKSWLGKDITKKSLGCGRKIKASICGVANAWGKEHLCKECDAKMILNTHGGYKK